MATYIASNRSRDSVTLVLSKAEADGVARLAELAWDEGLGDLNPKTMAAADRVLKAISAATNTSARRAGFFDDN